MSGFMDKRDRSRLWIMGALLPLIGAVIAGCSQVPQQAVPAQAVSITEEEAAFSVLAGLWDYEEGTAVVPLEIDRSGVGTYPYKGGRLITDSLDDHHWQGRWHQATRRAGRRWGRWPQRYNGTPGRGRSKAAAWRESAAAS